MVTVITVRLVTPKFWCKLQRFYNVAGEAVVNVDSGRFHASDYTFCVIYDMQKGRIGEISNAPLLCGAGSYGILTVGFENRATEVYPNLLPVTRTMIVSARSVATSR